MGAINYKVTSGVFPITVQLIGNNGTLTNVHNAYESGMFDNVPTGAYTIRFTDDAHLSCLYEEVIDLCNECWEGYFSVTGGCIKYLEIAPIYHTSTITIVAAQQNSAYSLNGAAIFSAWNYNGTGTYQRVTNNYWANTPYPSLNGPLNRSAIWGDTVLDNQDIAVSYCIEIAIGKTYYIGVSADNSVKIKLNGTFILDQNRSAIMTMFGSSDITTIQKNWFIYPVFFPAGKNVIEVFGHNELGTAALGVEIYDATKQDLVYAQSDSDLGSKLLFRSSSLIGTSLKYEYSTLQGYHGYTCNEGYALNTCDTLAVCVQRETMTCAEASTTTSTTTTSTTTTTSSTTTSTTTFPTYEACNVFGLHFSTQTNNQIGFLTVGSLVITGGYTLGDYVIEWRLNSYDGPTILVSGNRLAAASDVAEDHPLINVPVVDGILCPVIRFVDIDGIRYGISKSDQRYAPDLKQCLYPPISVQPYTCNNGGNGIYAHSISYNNVTQTTADSSKTVTIDLNSDGSTGYLAWEFTGKTVSDSVEFFYVSGETETRVKYFVIGYDINTKLGLTTNFTTTPMTVANYMYKGVIDLTKHTFVAGDYVKMKVTPSYADPLNTNTDWILNFKCLPVGYFNDPAYNPLWSQIDPCSFNAVMDNVNCRMNVTWNQLGALTSPAITYFENAISAGLYLVSGAESLKGSTSGQFLRFNETSAHNYSSTVQCHDYDETLPREDYVTISKLNGVVNYLFMNLADYTYFKNRYLAIRADLANGYSADPTNVNYYHWITLAQYISGRCGDGFTTLYMSHHYSTPYTFDDANLLFSITPALITNQYVDHACSNVYETVGQAVGTMNSAYYMANQTVTTKVGYYYAATRVTTEVASDIDVLRQAGLYMYNDNMMEVYGAYDLGDCYPGYPTAQYKTYYKYYLRFKVTDINDPVNNYEVYNTLVNGCYSATNQTLIYKIANGVRLVPATC